MNVTVNESLSASFRCNASGDPIPTVTWFKGGFQLSAGGRVVIGEYILTVVNTVASDSGQYSCNVSNGISFHVGVAYLIVQGKSLSLVTYFLVSRFQLNLIIYLSTSKRLLIRFLQNLADIIQDCVESNLKYFVLSIFFL